MYEAAAGVTRVRHTDGQVVYPGAVKISRGVIQDDMSSPRHDTHHHTVLYLHGTAKKIAEEKNLEIAKIAARKSYRTTMASRE